MPSSKSSSDEDHWPDDASYHSSSAVPASNYDSKNGLRQHVYLPAEEAKKKEPTPPPSPPKVQPAPALYCVAPAYQQNPAAVQCVSYPPMQYACSPGAYPAPAYYGMPAMMQQDGMPYACYPVYQPPVPAPEKPKKREPMKWQGRSKAEIEEDNMKIAAREGAYDKRKVEPIGLKADQMVWVVEVDGSHTLRTYATAKGFKGEWKADPRFKDSWYFVRE